MIARFPLLTCFAARCGSLLLAVLAVLALISKATHAEPPQQAPNTSGTPNANAQASQPVQIDASQLVKAAQVTLMRRRSIRANVRLQIRMYGAEIVGSGTYLQLENAGARRFRWELRTQVAKQTSTMTQVSDGRFLWTDRRLPSKQTVTRVDMRRLAESTPAGRGPIPGTAMPIWTNAPLGGGGMPRMLAALLENYRFSNPTQQMLKNTPVFVVEGQLLKNVVEKTPVDTKSKVKEDPPQHLPNRVRMYVGRQDLFPYMLEYFSKGTKPDLSIQWYDVQLDQPIDVREFDYAPPAEVNWRDVTDEMIRASSESGQGSRD